ncbi:MAG: cobyrinate a,c-diamide synthase [Rubrobacter sp.]
MTGSPNSTPRIVVAGTHSGAGKTTVATGLMAAFAAQGKRVAPFKVGPDFIDPSYHALATGRPGRNLDAFLSREDLIGPLFEHGSRNDDLAVIEGVMGLFDGRSGTEGFASTAHVAKLLGAPVLLVVDASAMSRSVAAMVHGYATFDSEVNVSGVVLNRVGSSRHEAMLREAIRPLGIPVAGVLRRDRSIETPDRHLGLVPVAERKDEARRAVEELGRLVGVSCDLDRIERLARTSGNLDCEAWEPKSNASGEAARIAVATGPAFSFLYEENLESMRSAGAEISFFDPTTDGSLPEGTDALYLGGGFPEAYAEALASNEPMKREVHNFAASGRPVVAECGGLMYLTNDLDGREMCRVVDATTRMAGRLMLGYREAVAVSDSPLLHGGERINGHEFHYSAVEHDPNSATAWSFDDGCEEGFVCGPEMNVHASYLHTHWAATPEVARRFVGSALLTRDGVRR